MKANVTVEAPAVGRYGNAGAVLPSVAIDGLDISVRGMRRGRVYLVSAEDSPARFLQAKAF
jgi:hypothetical protein